MAKYRYAGPGPQETPEGGIVRPGDEEDFAEEPAWGPWELTGAPETPAAPPATPAPAPKPDSPAPASPAAPATTSAPAAPKET